MGSTMVGSEKKGRGVWKNDLNEVDGFEAEHMMGEMESVRASEEMLKEMVAVVVLVGMNMIMV